MFDMRCLQDGINKCRPYLVCCLGELNDVELGAASVNASILHENPWLKVDTCFSTQFGAVTSLTTQLGSNALHLTTNRCRRASLRTLGQVYTYLPMYSPFQSKPRPS